MGERIVWWVLAIFCAAGLGTVFGMALGFFFGERGRRKDLMWYTEMHQRPNDLGSKAEIDVLPDPETNARTAAELDAITSGLRDDLKREGISASEKEIEEEALRLATQLSSEIG